MASYKVLKLFRDKDSRERFEVNSFYESDNQERVSYLAKEGYIEAEETSQKEVQEANLSADFDSNVKHTGGGWYQLPNGEKVQGRDEAIAAYEESQKSGE